MKNFQYIILGVFILLAAAAVIIFSGFTAGRDGNADLVEVSLWGTLPESPMRIILNELKNTDRDLKVSYRQISSDRFRETLIEALAAGAGPDLVILPENLIYSESDKLFIIPFEQLAERDFRGSFIESADIFLGSRGAVGLPVFTDPTVMYWNRRLLSSAGIASPPKFWTEFVLLSERLNVRDGKNNILQSMVALGGWANINHPKEIISSLILQTGDQIVRQLPSAEPVLGQSRPGAETAVRFYTEFGNPAKTTYSWNSSLVNSLEAFSAEKLVFYFGLSSDLERLKRLNPNLNFDVTILPQIQGASFKTTFSHLGAIAILKNSPNLNSSITMAYKLAWGDFPKRLNEFGLSPARRDLLAEKPADPILSVFYNSTILSRTWLDPNPTLTDAIFRDMIEEVVIGRSSPAEAVGRAAGSLAAIFRK